MVYRCVVVLKVRGWGVECEGMGEEAAVIQEGMNSLCTAMGVALKRSYQKACEYAFSKLVLVVLPSEILAVHTLTPNDLPINIEAPPVNIVDRDELQTSTAVQ